MAYFRTRPSELWPLETRRPRGARRQILSYAPRLGWLEARTLLAGTFVPDLTAKAVPLALGSPLTETIAPLETTYYRISSDTGGKLMVMLQASGFAARVSIVDPQGHPLVQSDGPAPGGGNDLIDLHVAAGDNFVEVQSLGGGGSYQITALLTPSQPPFKTVGSKFPPAYAPIAVGDFNGDKIPDLVAPDGIHLGLGDGTFSNVVSGGPLAQDGWSATAIAVGNFSNDGLPDIAVAEISPDEKNADVRVLRDVGSGQLQVVDTFALVDSQPVAIQVIDFGNGIEDLAVADSTTGNVAIFVGDGKGGFSPGPILAGGSQSHPSALAAGRLGDGHVDLIVADQGDPSTGNGQGLRVFQADGPGQFVLSETIALGSAPSAVVAADLTGDGFLDLAVAECELRSGLRAPEQGQWDFHGRGVLLRRECSRVPGRGRFRQRSHRPGNRQRELGRRLGTPGQWRRYLPASVAVRGRLFSRGAGGGRPQRRPTSRPGCCQPAFQRYLRAPGTRRRHIPGPVDEPGGKWPLRRRHSRSE